MYAIVDIETTGGFADTHRITEVAIYHHDGMQITDHYHTLVNPGRDIPYFITGLTGIDASMVKDAPLFEEIADEVLRQLEGRIFVAHNAHFDYSFLRKELEEAGRNWSARKLCTVRLSRKIVPGLKSYSLGRLAEHFGIIITDRHRATGDAEATARIFDLLLKQDADGVIAKALLRSSGETILPPNLPRSEFEKLPAASGIYFFHDEKGTVIYVGKAINIRKRITGHFSGEAREWNRSNVRNEIHQISYELTGSELIALIREAQEIRRIWPRYNIAQKFRAEEWGIFDYEDQQGYCRLAVTPVARGSHPLISFASKGDAWNFMWEKVQAHTLCPRLTGLQKGSAACYSHAEGNCLGACVGQESAEAYNTRVRQAIDEMGASDETLLIVDKGRTSEEQSVVLIERGAYAGFGFIPSAGQIERLDDVRPYIKSGRDNRFVQNLINSYLLEPRSGTIYDFSHEV